MQGYKNGRVVALRKPDDKGKYFRRKAFSPEVCFPERVFRRVLFIEDTLRNLELFEEDFPETIQYEQNNDQKLRLYHFRSPQKEREVQAHRPRGGNLRASGEYADVW